MSAETSPSPKYTQKEVAAYLSDIEKKLTESENVATHSLVALNQLFRLPNAPAIFEGEVKERARDIWIKLKSRGIQLVNPPILFGIPAVASDGEDQDSDEEDRDEEE